MTRPLRVLDCFSGIGGWSLAAEWAGMEIAGQIEIDPFCRKVLAKHWPDVPRMGDIHDVRGDEFGSVGFIVGSAPCQPYSVAGKRRGEADDRALWPEMRRLAEILQPAWCAFEQVPGFIGLGLDDLLADLDAIGYETGALVVPAAGVGAPHRRDRLWIIAHLADAGGIGRERWPGEQGDGGSPALRGETCDHAWHGSQASDVADAKRQPVRADRRGADDGATGGASGEGDQRKWLRADDGDGGRGSGTGLPADTADGGIRRGGAPEQAGQPAQPRQALPAAGSGGWGAGIGYVQAGQSDAERSGGRQALGGVGRGADGLSTGLHGRNRWLDGTWEHGIPRVTEHESNRAARLKALGNSICPQVAYEIIRGIAEIEASS